MEDMNLPPIPEDELNKIRDEYLKNIKYFYLIFNKYVNI